MRLKVVSSGSVGNSYIIYNDDEVLLIEVGVKFERIKKALNFDLSKVKGCIITHAHKDHCVGVKELTAAGIDAYCLKETADTFGFFNHRIRYIKSEQQFTIGGFTIRTFPLQHDVPCLGFYIRHAETGNFCFITDTYFCEYTFPDLNNIIIEANYCQTILDERLERGATPEFLRDRVLRSHMSLQTCKEFLQANDIKKVYNILLIHLSDTNSHAERFKREVRLQTLRTINIAEPGLDINFNKSPF